MVYFLILFSFSVKAIKNMIFSVNLILYKHKLDQNIKKHNRVKFKTTTLIQNNNLSYELAILVRNNFTASINTQNKQ